MAEERPTFADDYINDTLTQDDTDVLRMVLQSEHARGISPVSTYGDIALDEE